MHKPSNPRILEALVALAVALGATELRFCYGGDGPHEPCVCPDCGAPGRWQDCEGCNAQAAVRGLTTAFKRKGSNCPACNHAAHEPFECEACNLDLTSGKYDPECHLKCRRCSCAAGSAKNV